MFKLFIKSVSVAVFINVSMVLYWGTHQWWSGFFAIGFFFVGYFVTGYFFQKREIKQYKERIDWLAEQAIDTKAASMNVRLYIKDQEEKGFEAQTIVEHLKNPYILKEAMGLSKWE